MALRMKDKVAIVTGAASGIGEAIARRFCEEGAIVLLSDVQVDKGEAVARELPRSIFVRADVTREEEVAALVDQARTRFGRLDCMVNNAGMAGGGGRITPISDEYCASTLPGFPTPAFVS